MTTYTKSEIKAALRAVTAHAQATLDDDDLAQVVNGVADPAAVRTEIARRRAARTARRARWGRLLRGVGIPMAIVLVAIAGSCALAISNAAEYLQTDRDRVAEVRADLPRLRREMDDAIARATAAATSEALTAAAAASRTYHDKLDEIRARVRHYNQTMAQPDVFDRYAIRWWHIGPARLAE